MLYDTMSKIEDEKGYKVLQTVIEEATMTYKSGNVLTFTEHFERHLDGYLTSIRETNEKKHRRQMCLNDAD